MASFEMQGIDDLIAQLNKASNLNDVAPKMIEEALPILEQSLKDAVQEEVNKEYATGELVRSIKKSKSHRKNQYGYFGVVRPTGKDQKGVRNMEKLVYLHYGTTKQAARPVINKATIRVRKKVIDKMQEVYNREAAL